MEKMMFRQAAKHCAGELDILLTGRETHALKSILQQIDPHTSRTAIKHDDHRSAMVQHGGKCEQPFFCPLKMVQHAGTKDEIESALLARQLPKIGLADSRLSRLRSRFSRLCSAIAVSDRSTPKT